MGWIMRLYLSGFILLLATNGYSLTLDQLVSRTRQLVGDTAYYTPVPKLTDKMIISFLNDGQRYAIAYPWFLTNRTSFALISGTTEYGLPSDYQAVKRLSLNGTPLAEATLDGLDSTGGDWTSVTGIPTQYYTRSTSFTAIGFYPAPDSNASGMSVSMDYYAQALPLVRGSDVPYNGLAELEPLHESLCRYAVYRYYLLTGNQVLADIYAKEFISDVDRLRKIIESKPNYRPGLQIQPLIQR